MLQIGAVFYPGFEMLDMFGPLEMFSMLGSEQVTINTIAEQAGPVVTAVAADIQAGPKVVADLTFADAPQMDLLLIPGGFGTLPELANENLMTFIRQQAAGAKIVASVCTGSALLAKAGVLDGHKATSNKQMFVLATQQSDQVEWVSEARWVVSGKFYTSSGVSAGTDMAVAIIQELYGDDVRQNVINGAEYTWNNDPSNDPFAGELNKLAGLLPA
ncbi:MAG: DJ-1/PfpI family protein [Pseudomonadota bacterium]